MWLSFDQSTSVQETYVEAMHAPELICVAVGAERCALSTFTILPLPVPKYTRLPTDGETLTALTCEPPKVETGTSEYVLLLCGASHRTNVSLLCERYIRLFTSS